MPRVPTKRARGSLAASSMVSAERQSGVDRRVEVLRQSSIASDPREESLHDRATRLVTRFSAIQTLSKRPLKVLGGRHSRSHRERKIKAGKHAKAESTAEN